jgi:ABC-type hemin transport system ATPase subunit
MISRGSEWRRWEPHIHAPGTVLNNQFRGNDPWGDYLAALEAATPAIEAVAVTDYYVTDAYETVLTYKSAGRLPGVKLIFPNIELRLDAAARSGFVNLHLLVSPDDPDHLAQVERILRRLQFTAYNDRFDCTRDDLIRLGKRANPAIKDDVAALRHGATQFKVSFGQLREVYRGSGWATKNILIAVAGGSGDGTSGLQQAADATARQEIEKFAHIIFSSSPAQREFWLGQRPGTSVAELQTRYDGCKPCLHGSDAHSHVAIAQPADKRYSWIKGGLEFDALRQACIDPGGRAHVGENPPQSAMPSQIIFRVRIDGADWALTPDIPLNCGLVAIIGPRGSGKTALADALAAGCDAVPPSGWGPDDTISPSFLARAKGLIDDATVTLTWGDGATVSRCLDGSDAGGPMAYPRARYLSQQFVEELCSANGVSDGLVAEIERVIYESHEEDDRDGAIDFAELRDQETTRFRQARAREARAIGDISERIGAEFEKEALVQPFKNQVAQKKNQVAGYKADLAKLVVKGTPAEVARHEALREAAEARRCLIQAYGSQRRTFVALQDEVKSMRATGAPEMLRQTIARHANSGMSDEQWDEFLLVYKGKVDANLKGYIAWADKEIAKLNGISPPPGDPAIPLVADDADLAALAALPLAAITAEMARLETRISADNVVRKQYAALNTRIGAEAATLRTLEAKFADAKGAAERRRNLQSERDDAYGRLFQAIINEQKALEGLYAPLMERLASTSGTLRKLSFSVRRIADVERWGTFAEENLLDRRKTGPFHGRGSLIAAATRALKTVWETGSAADVQAAMSAFMAQYLDDLLIHAPFAPAQQAEHRAWLKNFAHWLFDTIHITVRYEIAYDGIDIRKLSPGTRGIVLLLLYLALDDADDRPLIIDQPEENLDPKSVFDELVPLFVAAKARRQVIIVTHNANLVVNTDADQIIVAQAGPHAAGGLPPITYTAGGLENEAIRKTVCHILEGGEAAFRERARRLRVHLDR